MPWIEETLGTAEVLSCLGISAGLLSVAAYVVYIKDTYVGDTRPQRASWLIWSVLGSIAFFSQVSQGSGPSLWFAGVQVSGTITIFLLSIFAGRGAFLNRTDLVYLALAGLGLFAWHETNNAAYALGLTISISLVGGIATVTKAYRAPGSETLATWLISWVAAGLALVSVGSIDPFMMAYPAYLLVLKSGIILAIVTGRARIFRSQTQVREEIRSPAEYSFAPVSRFDGENAQSAPRFRGAFARS